MPKSLKQNTIDNHNEFIETELAKTAIDPDLQTFISEFLHEHLNTEYDYCPIWVLQRLREVPAVDDDALIGMYQDGSDSAFKENEKEDLIEFVMEYVAEHVDKKEKAQIENKLKNMTWCDLCDEIEHMSRYKGYGLDMVPILYEFEWQDEEYFYTEAALRRRLDKEYESVRDENSITGWTTNVRTYIKTMERDIHARRLYNYKMKLKKKEVE